MTNLSASQASAVSAAKEDNPGVSLGAEGQQKLFERGIKDFQRKRVYAERILDNVLLFARATPLLAQ